MLPAIRGPRFGSRFASTREVLNFATTLYILVGTRRPLPPVKIGVVTEVTEVTCPAV